MPSEIDINTNLQSLKSGAIGIEKDDRYFISKCLKGDPDSFSNLIDKYKSGIYAFVYSQIRNFSDAEDITQETFVKAYKELSNLRNWDSFYSWIYTIANNFCRNYIRLKLKQPDNEYIEDQETKLIESCSSKIHKTEQLTNFVNDSINSLPKIYQDVLLLHYLGGLSCEEIANIIRVSPANIRQRLSRGRTLLKNEILEPEISIFNSKKLRADFTYQVMQLVKHININPKPFWNPLGMSIVTAMTIVIFSFFTPINLTKYINIGDDLSPTENAMIYNKAEYDISIKILSAQKQDKYCLFQNFDDSDVSNWNGGYYEGTVDLKNKRRGKPIIKICPTSAKSGKYGLLFIKDKEPVKDKEYGSSCVASSPEFGPLSKKFKVDFDVIFFDYKNHIILLGENAPDETYDENTISNLGIGFSHDIVSIRSKTYSEIGRYKTNEFYHVTVIVDPATEKFDIIITGNLYDLDGNFVDKLSMRELEFAFPITEKGIRRLNLYTGTRLNSEVFSVSMGLDNIVVNADI